MEKRCPELTWSMMKDIACGYAETIKDSLLTPISLAQTLREKLLTALVPVGVG